MKYTYRSGQTPLDGYTIKRGVGHGGFGEVYFAVSDGGKEVALKLLHGQSDIELRGVANCLNMKHPNLVHVYDLREDRKGDKWLVMEYVLGESMSAVLNRHPNGLPQNMVREWFAALARAVAYLHDRGVVHRDLKPANIFLESGTLKVGDYGLCKSISTSQKQTRTVGTVHYMAPEVSTGNYSQRIDIYACGVILYEMLTGKLPFDGESDGEILMKHLTATPDLGDLPVQFRGIVARSLDKNPVQRYETILDMAKAVEAAFAGSEQQSPAPAPTDTPLQKAIPLATPIAAKVPIAQPAVTLKLPADAAPRSTLLSQRVGTLLATPFLVAAGLVPYAVFGRMGMLGHVPDGVELGRMFFTAVSLGWVVVLATARLNSKSGDTWNRRFTLALGGALVGVLAFWLDGWLLPGTAPVDTGTTLGKYVLYFAGVLALGRWWRCTALDRRDRVSVYALCAAAFCSTVLIFLWPPIYTNPLLPAVVPVVLAVFAVQLASPHAPIAPRPVSKKLRLRTA